MHNHYLRKHHQKRHFGTQRGFNLIEVMAVVAILGIVTAYAAPNFSEFMARQTMRAQANNLQNILTNARSEALTRSAVIDVCWNFEDVAWAFPAATNIEDIDGASGAAVIGANSISLAIDSNPDVLITNMDLSTQTELTLTSGAGDTQGCVAFSAQGFLVGGAANEVSFSVADAAGDVLLNTEVSATGRSSVRKHEDTTSGG